MAYEDFLNELVKKNNVFGPLSDTGVKPEPAGWEGGTKWKRAVPGSMFTPSGQEVEWYNVTDGDTSSFFAKGVIPSGQDPNVIYNGSEIRSDVMPGVEICRWQFLNDRETKKDRIDPVTKKPHKSPADIYANEQWQDSVNLYEMVQKEGLVVKPVIQGKDEFKRDIVIQEVYDKKGNYLGDLAGLKLSAGRSVAFCQPSNTDTTTQSCWDAVRKADKAQEAGLGLHAATPKYNITKAELEERLRLSVSPHRKGTHNKKYGQDSRRKWDPEEWKIGDVYLPVQPISLNISQVRTSYNIPLLGFEAKPSSSYTTRTVIKIQCVFPNAIESGDLQRILLQYKYCPINLIRSKDLFRKIADANVSESRDHKFVSTIGRDYDQDWMVPVTMDEYTIYTIEGHPSDVGAMFQFSLFNYSAYFNDSPLDRLEYYKYIQPSNKEDYVAMILGKERDVEWVKKHDRRLAPLIERKTIAVPDNNKVLYKDKTLQLEDALHPYNFNVEDDMEITREIFKDPYIMQHGIKDSSVRLWKVSSAVKPSSRKFIDEPESISQWTNIEKDSLVFEPIVKSISIKYENVFGWQPVVGYSQPVAQYVGPGATHVSMNILTNKPDNISKLLKTYNELAEKDELFGIYDDRYIVSTFLTIFANAELCSLKDININSVQSHPGWSDINIMFQKTEYAVNARELNKAAEHDDYWGLNRILRPLEDPAYAKFVNGVLNAAAGNLLGDDTIKSINPNNLNLGRIRGRTKEALAILIKKLGSIGDLNFPDGKRRGGDVVKSLKITSAAKERGPVADSLFDIMVPFINTRANLKTGRVASNDWDLPFLMRGEQFLSDPEVMALRESLYTLADNFGKLKHDKYTTPVLVEMATTNSRRGFLSRSGKGDAWEAYEAIKDFIEGIAPYWTIEEYDLAAGNSLEMSFNGTPAEAKLVEMVLGVGMDPDDIMVPNKKTIALYGQFWQSDKPHYPAFAVTMIPNVAKGEKLSPSKKYDYNIGLVYRHMHNRGVNQFDSPENAEAAQKVAKEINAQINTNRINTLVLSKPFAAHRYYPGADTFIKPDQLISSSVGDWFYNSEILNLDGLLNKISNTVNEIKSPISDTPAWKAAFKQWGLDNQFTQMINDAGPLGVLQAVAYPDAKRDLSDTAFTKDDERIGKRKFLPDGSVNTAIEIVPNEWKRNGSALRGSSKSRNVYDEPFSSMSHLFFAKGYLDIAPKFAAMQKDFLDNQIRSRKYLMERKVSYLLNDNLALSGVRVGNSRSFNTASDTTLMELTGGVIPNADGAAKSIEKSFKYQGSWLLNSANISQAKDPATHDKAMTDFGFKNFTSDTKMMMNIPTNTPMAVSHSQKIWPKKAPGPTEKPMFVAQGKYTEVEKKEIARLKEIQTLEAEKGGISSATRWQLGQKYLLSQLPTSGLQHVFPTYKMYIIKSDTSDYKFYSLDNYYDFRLVQDWMVVRDRNNPVHLLKARILIDPRYITITDTLRQKTRHDLETREGKSQVSSGAAKIDTKDDDLFSMGRVPLRVGMRIAIKSGYHSDPRELETIFIGTITSLNGNMNTGIYDLECKGDGRELTVPATTQEREVTGNNYSEILAAIMRANPNVIHFGKVYGTFLERFSREHYVLMAIGKNVVDGGPLSCATLLGAGAGMLAVGTMMGPGLLATSVTAAGLASTGGGILSVPYSTAWDALTNKHMTHKFHVKQDNWFNSRMQDYKQWFSGALYDSAKASNQIAGHIYETYELNNDPVDDNIFAVDIWGKFGRGESMKINNKRSIWSVFQDIKRMYPNYSLDIRPYGSRSTIFLGPSEFSYWRTDDPLLAMAPQLSTISNRKVKGDERHLEALKAGIERDAFGNVDVGSNPIGGDGIAPFIPFQKQHIVTSFGDILMNGVKATPDRGWNEVVVAYGKDAGPTNANAPVEIIRANQNLEPGSIRRQYVNCDWIASREQARQYGIGILKEGVEKMYGGTLVIRGNPKVEPNDRVYICDKVNKMYGWVEVETVIHKMDQQSGFTTHIVPNMVCSVNSDAYQTTGHIARKLISDKAAVMTFENTMLFLGGLILGPEIVAAVATIAPLVVTLGGAALISYVIATGISDAIDDSAKMLDKFAAKNEDEYLSNVLEGALRAEIASTSFFGGYALNSLIRGIRYIRNEGGAKAVVQTAYDNAALYAMKGFNVASDVGTNLFSSQAKSFINSIGTKIGKDFAGASNPLLAQKQIETWMSDLERTNPAEAAKMKEKIKAMEKDGGLGKVIEKWSTAEEKSAERALKKSKALEERMAKAESHAGKGAGKKVASGANKLIKNGFFMMLLSSFEAIPMAVEAICINAMTNANVIVLHPIWQKNSLLLTGMEGYQTSNAFMHMKDQIMFAKKTFGKATDAIADWAPVTYGGPAPELKDSSNVAAGNTAGVFKRKSGTFIGAKDTVSKADILSFRSKIIKEAIDRGLSQEDIKNLETTVQLESQWNPFSRSSTTAVGLFQFVERTGAAFGIYSPSNDRRTDPDANIEAGVKLYIQNKAAVKADGFDPTGLNIFIYHNQGGCGGKKILTAIQNGSYVIPDPMCKGENVYSNMGVNNGSDVRSYYNHIKQLWDNSASKMAARDSEYSRG